MGQSPRAAVGVEEGGEDPGHRDGAMKTLLTLCLVVVAAGCLTTPTQTVGKLTFDGGTYEGEIRDGKANGQGTWTRRDGTTQSGLWEGGRYLGPSPAQTNAPPASGTDRKP